MKSPSCSFASSTAVFLLLGLSVFAAPQEAELLAPSRIARVVVYSDRAVVERDARLALPAGRTRVLFDDLPERIDPASLQVQGKGGIVLEDIVFTTRHFASIPDERIKALETELEAAKGRVQEAADKIARTGAEKKFLEKIVDKVTAKTEGAQPAPDPAAWTQMIAFYRDRTAALDLELRAAERSRAKLDEEAGKLARELSAISGGRQKKRNQTLVVVMAAKAQEAELSLSYVVEGPSWTPVYDIRVDSEKRRLEISYSANIVQNTGEDWAGVGLSLSTARPEIGGSQPELEPWYLRPAAPVYGRANRASDEKAKMQSGKEEAVQMFAKPALPEAPSPEPSPADVRTAEASKGAVAVIFRIPGDSSIQSDAARHRVSITTRAFPAAFRYSAAPRLSTYAYLKAKVKNESDFPFLPGPSKIFLDGNFVADSRLDLVAVGEEFWTFLGVDESVKVEYKLLRRFKEESGVFDKKTRMVYQYETGLTNTKKVEAELVLWDQLPISSDQKILVKLIEPKYLKDSDSLKKNNEEMFEWLLLLKSGEARKIPFSFSVEYPQDMRVEGL